MSYEDIEDSFIKYRLSTGEVGMYIGQFTDYILDWLDYEGWTIKELAKTAGISEQYLSDLLREKKPMNVEVGTKILDAVKRLDLNN